MKISKTVEELKAYLTLLSPNTKVRIIFTDFISYKAILNDLPEYRTKFIMFKEMKNFNISEQLIASKTDTNTDLIASLKEWLEKNKVDDNIKNILLKEIK